MTLQTIDEKMKEFLAHLTERHPNLTQGEKHLASLLRVNLVDQRNSYANRKHTKDYQHESLSTA